MSSLVTQTGSAENTKRALLDLEADGHDSSSNNVTQDDTNNSIFSDARDKLLEDFQHGNDNNKPSSPPESPSFHHSGTMELAFSNIGVMADSKTLLTNVSGRAYGSELLAIMGPSGAGKTTLLNTLAGRLAISCGHITINDVPMNKDFKRKISYVLQEDIFFPTITLRDTLNFIAMIRLPEYMSREEKLSKVDEIIDVLDLRKCQDTIIGDSLNRGLSGGEKKRASIAGELITDPKIIYLDEPTSGLDYSSALSLVSTLKKIAKKMNKIVVLTIHQPSSAIFFKFDKLLLLCDGQVGYYGPSKEVIPFFADLGLHLEPYANPADFVVDKLKEDKEVTKKIIEAASKLRVDQSPQKTSNALSPLNETIKQSDTGSVHVSFEMLGQEGWFDKDSKWPTGFLTQYKELTIRTYRQSKRRFFDKIKIIENVILCVIVSLIWFQLPRTEQTLNDRMGVLFFLVCHTGFAPLFDSVVSFPSERVVINKERAAGWYRLSAYFLAKNTMEMPLTIVQPTVFVSVCYWCVGLNGFAAFIITIIVTIVNTMAGQSIGLFLGIAFMDFRRATVMCTVTLLFMMLLGGFYTRHLANWLQWIKYFSFPYYSFHSLLHAEFTDADPLSCMHSNSSHVFQECISPNVTSISNDRVFEHLGMESNFATYFMPLFVFIIGLRVASYIILRFVHAPPSV